MAPALDEHLSAALAQMTPRRYELLVVMAGLAAPFLAADVRRALHERPGLRSSLLRDLRSLEVGGWLTADPPHEEARQGRTVYYEIAPLAWGAFQELSDRLIVARDADRSTPDS